MSTAVNIVRKARAAGVRLELSPSGGIAFAGDAEAIEKLTPLLVEYKAAILTELRREEDAARRRLTWWAQPVPEWRAGRLEIRNLLSGKSFVVDLRR